MILEIAGLCRLQLSRVEVAIGVDAALSAMRNYFERAARELHARGGRILPRNGEAPPTLQEQEEALAAWYTFLVTRLRVFKVCILPLQLHPCTSPSHDYICVGCAREIAHFEIAH